MASGKQLSFQYGEVSPTLHFRSDAVSYAQGLGKLTNMYVRKSGGVSNRPGFEFIELAASQENIPLLGEPMGIRGFTYWAPTLEKWVTIQYGLFTDALAPDVNGFKIEGEGGIYQPLIWDESLRFPEPSKVRFAITDSSVFVTPGFRKWQETEVRYNIAIVYGFTNAAVPAIENFPTGRTPVSIPTATLSFNIASPFLPVSYLFTVTYTNGEEIVCGENKSTADTGASVAAMGVCYPHSNGNNNFALSIDAEEGISHFSLYRASGRGGVGSSYYRLVSKQLYKPDVTASITGTVTTSLFDKVYTITGIASTTSISVGMILVTAAGGFPAAARVNSKTTNTITLNKATNLKGLVSITSSFSFTTTNTILSDYGAEASAITPPIDANLFATNTVTNYNIDGFPQLGGVEAAAYYQQRLVMAFKPGTTNTIKSGTCAVSKLGAVRQIKSPLIYSDTGAFSFNIPVTDGTPVNAFLSMERLIAFTERGVYVVRGGDQGVLTPTTINPVSVSEEGCSKVIEPVLAGRKGYFVNASHSKIMCIAFGNDANLEVFEATFFSEHIIAKDIAQMVSLSCGGGEETLYILRRDGKLVCVTLNEDNSHGFALIETDGYIESIYRGKAVRPFVPNALNNADRYYDVLMAYVIRNGKRLVERLNVRDDVNREGEFFADCYGSFGYRLVSNGLTGYSKIALGATPEYAGNPYINISSAGSWLAGANIPLTISGSTETLPSNVLHFFYDDENGKTQTLQYIGDPVTEILNLKVDASLAINVLTYTSKLNGPAGNAISVRYINSALLSVAVSGYAITVSLVSGVTTAAQVKTAIEGSVLASLFVSVALTGSGSTTQTTQAVQNLAGGVSYLHQIQGYFTSDVPEILRNTTNNVGLTTLERNRIQSRWLPAFNSLSGDELNGPKYAVFAPLTPWVSGRAYAVGDTVVEGGVDYVALVAHTSSIFSSNLSAGKWGPYSSQAAVSVFADGEILSSPLNPNSPTLYLEKDGYGEASITLPDYYTYGYIGAPYTSEFETMDLETADNRTLTDSNKLINAVGVGLYQTRGGFYGMPGRPITEMEEIVSREDEDVSNATVPVNGYISVNIPAEWNRSGRLNVKQVDPAPMTILAVYPKGISGD